MATIELKLLFANYGNRSGILYTIDIPKPDLVTVIQYEPKLEENLPAVIPPSQGMSYEVTIFLTQVSIEKTWKDIWEDKDSFVVEVIFKGSTSFPWNKIAKKKIFIDFQELKNLAERVH